MRLERGALLPHFAVKTVDGGRFDYGEVWQRRNLLVVALPDAPLSDTEQQYVTDLTSREDAFVAYEARCVVTKEAVPGVEAPAVIVADRWGEIYLVAVSASVSDLPKVAEILEYLRYVAHECPECQGESR